MLPAALTLLLAPLAAILCGARWHASRPQQSADIISLAYAKARREQAQGIGDPDLNSVHGAIS